jgi:hypothetical protein
LNVLFMHPPTSAATAWWTPCLYDCCCFLCFLPTSNLQAAWGQHSSCDIHFVEPWIEEHGQAHNAFLKFFVTCFGRMIHQSTLSLCSCKSELPWY